MIDETKLDKNNPIVKELLKWVDEEKFKAVDDFVNKIHDRIFPYVEYGDDKIGQKYWEEILQLEYKEYDKFLRICTEDKKEDKRN